MGSKPSLQTHSPEDSLRFSGSLVNKTGLMNSKKIKEMQQEKYGKFMKIHTPSNAKAAFHAQVVDAKASISVGPTEETAHLQSSQKGDLKHKAQHHHHCNLHILKFNPCNIYNIMYIYICIYITAYATLTHQVSQSFGDLPGKKRHLFPWIPEASARSSARETHGDDSGGDLREGSSSVLSSSPSEEKISNNPNRDKKHIIPLNSSSLDFQRPRGIGQIQVETI